MSHPYNPYPLEGHSGHQCNGSCRCRDCGESPYHGNHDKPKDEIDEVHEAAMKEAAER